MALLGPREISGLSPLSGQKADIDQVARRFVLRRGPRALDANVIVTLDFGSTGAPARRDVNRKLAMKKLGAVQGVP